MDVYIPENMNYDDPTPGEELHIHYQAGTHHLNGKQALEVARFRHNNDGSGYTDTGRAEMHRQMLVALAKKVVSWNSIPKVTAFVELFQTYVKTDLSASDMLFFATQAMGVDFSSGITQGELTGRGDGVVGNSKWCYVFQPEDILPTLNEQLNPYTRDLTADDWICPSPTAIFKITDLSGPPTIRAAHFYFLHRSRLTSGRFHGMMEKKQRG